MRRKRLLAMAGLFACLLLLSPTIFAQTKVISGTVTDSSGMVLQGVSVIPKGGTGRTTKAQEGKFRLSVPVNVTTLVISSVGYTTKMVPVQGSGMVISISAANAS